MHVALDDTTRLAYVDVLADEQKPAVISFPSRAIACFNSQGSKSSKSLRVMCDNGTTYVPRTLAKTSNTLGFRQMRTRL